MVFSHWYQQIGSEPLLENDSELFVARLVISPPRAEVWASCQLQEATARSSALPEEGNNTGEFSSLCVMGGTLLQLREHARKHEAYGCSWISTIVKYVTIFLVMIVVLTVYNLMMYHGHNKEDSDKRGLARIGSQIIILLIVFLSPFIGSKASDYFDRESERRCTAIQSFSSDLLLQLSEITEALQRFGYVVSTQKNNGDAFEVVIQKSLEWSSNTGLPPANTEENQAKLTEVNVNMIQCGWLPRDTPLDIWLFGGLMMCLQNASKANAKHSRWCSMIFQALLLTCWFASLVAWFTIPFFYALLVAFVVLPVSVFLGAAAVGYYKECTDAPKLHTVFEEIIDDLSPISNERVGYTMNYVIEPGWLRGTTKGKIKFHETAKEQDGNSDGLMTAQIV